MNPTVSVPARHAALEHGTPRGFHEDLHRPDAKVFDMSGEAARGDLFVALVPGAQACGMFIRIAGIEGGVADVFHGAEPSRKKRASIERCAQAQNPRGTGFTGVAPTTS